MKKILSLCLIAFALFVYAPKVQAADALTYNLRLGMKNDSQVRIMQNIFITHGYLTGTTATGNFGPMTFTAVKRYQLENNINPTGFVGPITRASLNTLYSSMGFLSYPVGCTSTAGFSTVTGLSCAVSSTTSSVTLQPVVASNISSTGATISGSYTTPTATYTTVWFEYAFSQQALLNGQGTKVGQIVLYGTNNNFSVNLSNLIFSTTYYVRAGIKDQSQVTTYGSIISFTTMAYGHQQNYGQQNQVLSPYQPVAVTSSAVDVSLNSATLWGSYDSKGSPTTIYFEYWSQGGGIQQTSQISVGSSISTTQASVVNLSPATSYSFRLVASNQYGVTYGNTQTFVTQQGNTYVYVNTTPTIATGTPTNVSTTSATFTSAYNSSTSGVSPFFMYGLTSTSLNQLTSVGGSVSGSGTYTTSVTNLTPSTVYFVKGCIVYGGSTICDNSYATFTTSAIPVVPLNVTTGSATIISGSSATLHGTFTAPGGTTATHFEYKPALLFGSYTSTNTINQTGTSGSMSVTVTGLNQGMTYVFRAVVSNGNTTLYGTDVQFVPQPVMDNNNNNNNYSG